MEARCIGADGRELVGFDFEAGGHGALQTHTQE